VTKTKAKRKKNNTVINLKRKKNNKREKKKETREVDSKVTKEIQSVGKFDRYLDSLKDSDKDKKIKNRIT